MKKTFILSLMAAMIVCSCSKEEAQQEASTSSGNGKTVTVYIDGETANSTVSVRSTDGTVYFDGGYATGAGVYDGNKRPIVEAHPDAGYEVDFFYGGPESEPKRYDYSTSGKTTFNVALNGTDHYFKCGFKEKKRTLTVNAGAGGTATGSGTYQCDTPITIKATPESGYEFAGWVIDQGDVTIADKNNATTTATLNSLNSTITALFDKVIPKEYVTVRVSFNSNFSATVTASGTEITGEKYFTGQSGTFKVLKGGTVTIRVMRGTITFDGEEYPAAGIDNINVWGSSSIIVSEKNTWTVTFPANDNMMSVEVHCYTGGNIN